VVKQQLEEYPVLIYADSKNESLNEIKEELRRYEIRFEAFEINHMAEGSEIRKLLFRITKSKQMPYVFINEKYWGTEKELFESIADNSLFQELDRTRISYRKDIK
jgi:glutaredoxin